jgi:hypothetical protein
MNFLVFAAVALSTLVVAGGAQAQQTRLFFEGDIVRGDQNGAPGPFCVLNSQFKRLEKVVWRIRVLDQTGEALDDKALKSLVIEIPDGQKFPARFGRHPAPRLGPTVDHFWTSRWIIPADYPTGSFSYKVTATTQDGYSQAWEPFKVTFAHLTIANAAIELKPQPKN